MEKEGDVKDGEAGMRFEVWRRIEQNGKRKLQPCANHMYIYTANRDEMKASVLSAVGYVPPFCLEVHVTYVCRR